MTYTEEQINELEKQLLICLKKYEEGNSQITDDKYDSFKKILFQVKPDSILFTKIGNIPKKNKSKIPFVLGSLTNKYKDTVKDNIEDWLDLNETDHGYILSHKLDGLAVEVCYHDGLFSQAWLRGDGFIGQDVTEKIKMIAQPKLNIECEGKQYFKCEILLGCDVDSLGFANKRAGAAGIMNRDDTSEMKYLYILAHTWANPKIEYGYQEKLRMEMLSKLFNKIVKWEFVLFRNQIVNMAEILINEETQYDKDGIVICRNESMVENVKHPDHKIAFKFNQLTGIAIVKEIEWNLSRTKKYIPKIIIHPLDLGGSTINKVAAFNAKYIYDNNIGPGAKVEILKAGDIIPYVNKIISTDQSPEMKTNCPSCNSILISDDTHLICDNSECPGVNEKRIVYFFERLGLEEFGEKMITSLNCTNIPDIFKLTKNDIMKIYGWAETSADDFVRRVQDLKTTTPEKLLTALGIENVGSTISKLLLNNFTFKELIDSTYPHVDPVFIKKVASLYGVGEKITTSIVSGLRDNHNLLIQLEELGLIHKKDETNNILKGSTFCITGKMSFPRKTIQLFIEQNGGSYTSATSCQYLVCNDTSSGSNKLGKNKGIIISEEQLYELIKSRPI